MLNKKQILEILETKRDMAKKFKEGEYWRLVADCQAEINILEQILEIDEDHNTVSKDNEVKG